LRTARPALAGLRRAGRDAVGHRQAGQGVGSRSGACRQRDEDSPRSPPRSAAEVRGRGARRAAQAAVPRRADDDLPVDGRHLAGPDNFRARWRKVREDLGMPDVTSHSFRKSLATLIDDEGLSARIGAEARASETMDTYM